MYRPTKRGSVWLVMDTRTYETHGPGHKNKQDCLRQCEGFVPKEPLSAESSAVTMRAYLNERGIDQGDCRTTEELYHLIETGELPGKATKKNPEKRSVLQGIAEASRPSGAETKKIFLPNVKALAKPSKQYRPEKSDKDGLWHVFNMTRQYMYKGGWPNKVQCQAQCDKLNK